MKPVFIKTITVKQFLFLPKKDRPQNLYIKANRCSMEVCEGNVRPENAGFPELEFISPQNGVFWAQTIRSGAFLIHEPDFLYRKQ